MTPDHVTPDHVAVIGGGISGLATAYWLTQDDPPPRVTLLEASPHLGGKLRSAKINGIPIELGADAFVVRNAADGLPTEPAAEPAIQRLCDELGLADDLTTPDTTEVEIFAGGRRYPLPDGLIMGVPTRLGPLINSGLINTAGVLRAALDRVVPREVDVDSESVGDLIRHRFGQQVLDRLVDPLVSGVYAGDVDRLSAVSATPWLAEAARSHRSLLRGLDALDRPAPRFVTLSGGMSRLVDLLAQQLNRTGGAEVRRTEPAQLIEQADGRYRVTVAASQALTVDGLVLAVPAYAGAALLRGLAPDAAPVLREIPYASVATVTLVYEPDAAAFDGSGVLVPTSEQRLVKAATFVSNKWSSLMPDDRVVIRASVGRRGDDSPLRLDDDELAGAVHEDLKDIVGLTSKPAAHTVQRWERAMPQYEVGHAGRLERAAVGLSHLPNVALVGAAYDGVGIASCVEAARQTAIRLQNGPTT